MKKIVLIVIGALAGLYSAVAIIQMLWTLATRNPASVRGGTDIAATVAIVALAVGVCLICFQKAFRTPK